MPRGLNRLFAPDPELWSESEHGARESVCCICHDEFKADPPSIVTVLKCGHLFHTACEQKWFARSTLCPMCKRDVSKVAGSTGSLHGMLSRSSSASSARTGQIIIGTSNSTPLLLGNPTELAHSNSEPEFRGGSSRERLFNDRVGGRVGSSLTALHGLRGSQYLWGGNPAASGSRRSLASQSHSDGPVPASGSSSGQLPGIDETGERGGIRPRPLSALSALSLHSEDFDDRGLLRRPLSAVSLRSDAADGWNRRGNDCPMPSSPSSRLGPPPETSSPKALETVGSSVSERRLPAVRYTATMPAQWQVLPSAVGVLDRGQASVAYLVPVQGPERIFAPGHPLVTGGPPPVVTTSHYVFVPRHAPPPPQHQFTMMPGMFVFP
mmetsp:Transcript_28736/g.63348  ORF Transcript_28736/g.63348 Transcript_28736/m.63348 type:complete len:380 (+) Transcript_28736:15-1154(+)